MKSVSLFLQSCTHTHTHTHTPMDCETERWVVLSWHPKLCSNCTKPILLQSQQDTEFGGLTDCFQNTQKSSTFSQLKDSMGLFSFNPVDPTEVSLRGFVSEHSKRRVPHSLRYVRLDGFLPIRPNGSHRSQSQRICFKAQQKKSSTFSGIRVNGFLVSSHSTT